MYEANVLLAPYWIVHNCGYCFILITDFGSFVVQVLPNVFHSHTTDQPEESMRPVGAYV